MKKFFLFVTLALAGGMVHSQNVGIGTNTPEAKFSVGANSQFRVDENGNLIRINNVPMAFPGVQGANGQVLVNNGSGVLTWTNYAPSICGDGSAGDLFVGTGMVRSLMANGSDASLPGGANLNFNNITIAGTLFIPSGMVLKASGNVTINGIIAVQVPPNNTMPHPGVSNAAADLYSGGTGLYFFQAASLVKAPLQSGGSGKLPVLGEGGTGGGGLTIYAKGNITIGSGGLLDLRGRNGVNPQTAGIGINGSGGGAGGVVILAAKGNITNSGNILATGGNGANGFNGNGGFGEGGGGGGGGGIVVMITNGTISAGTVNVNGGAAGSNAAAVFPNTTINSGGGGGACGGNGGNGGGTIPGTSGTATPAAGSVGYLIRINADIDHYIPGRQ
ncbi:hypothetical protein ACFSQD_18050 [Flavihumibacter stibioxidans]|uniref:Uncharacterized protein n=1 Tax=Flavihumibacter stibioxidans TaxID=1834163 RepID=A0ABR7MCA5_9BACT|nr:hypothetical protein [Flavihumibacter stibioxidans]MBC6492672.1 hypothetical protein [Flavihumibacter stibioxidans]